MAEEQGANINKKLALKYKLAAFAWVLAAGTVGVCLPVMGKMVKAMNPEKSFFAVLKAFAAGVILATGFIHVLPDAFESLTSPCIVDSLWGDFPLTGLIAMVTSIGTLLVETYATSYYKRDDSGEEDGVMLIHTHTNHGHAPHESELESGKTQLLRYRVISQVLEAGIVVHSVIIGIALGASDTPNIIRPLVAALSLHQLFQGIGLGGCITQAKYNVRSVAVMSAFFCLTTPMGIIVGIGISNVYSDTSTTALIVQGVCNAASAGILIYMALVDLLSAEFRSPKLQNNSRLQLGAIVALLWGAGCMSLLAKWA